MKAFVVTGYGDLDKLEFREIEDPTPKNTEVLVRVKASSINPIDWKLRRGHFRFVWPLKFPFTPGFDVSGVVESVGNRVTQWREGDEVFAVLPKGGAHAEYVAVEGSLCLPIPHGLTFDEAAAIPAAAVSALQALRGVAKIKEGEHVVVNGASGGVGTFAIQIAVALGCRVTAVTSTPNIGLVESIGAHAVVDYTRDDVLDVGSFDVFFDVVPNQSFRRCSRFLSPAGVYVTSLPGLNALMWKTLSTLGRPLGYRKRCGWLIIEPNQADLAFVSRLVSEGKLRPVIHRKYRLEEARDANAQSESGHASGKIVLQIA